MVEWLLVALFASALISYGVAKEFSRRNKLMERFRDRDFINLDDLYSLHYSSSISRDDFLYLWGQISGILDIDPRKLRPSDSFEENLSISQDLDLSDEIEELISFLDHESNVRGLIFNPNQFYTLNDIVLYFGRNSSGSDLDDTE